MTTDRKRGYLYILLAAMLYSTTEVALKALGGAFAPMQVTVERVLLGAAALMRPSKSVADMELKSLKKKFKDKKFAAGCSRDVIARGAELLGWELDRLLGDTLEAMRAEEQAIEQAVAEAGAKDVDL